ncbi:Eco29kI family restriction endonuclease [Micromonospora chokoriensis]
MDRSRSRVRQREAAVRPDRVDAERACPRHGQDSRWWRCRRHSGTIVRYHRKMPSAEPAFFDPLSTEDLTNTICERFEREYTRPLNKAFPLFEGSGLYAIYCIAEGTDLYDPLITFDIPIYVGKSHSHSSATGKPAKTPHPLWSRVGQHRKSIGEAENLRLDHFGVRILCTPDVHCDLGENGLRVGFQPVWNSELTGFGSNEQGPTTRTSARSKWDTLHPGRRRSFGAEPHNPDILRAAVRKRVAKQVANCHLLPWRAHKLDSPSRSC